MSYFWMGVISYAVIYILLTLWFLRGRMIRYFDNKLKDMNKGFNKSIKKPKCKYGCNAVYLKGLKRYGFFCKKCGEYITSDTGCSNPFCPEKIND